MASPSRESYALKIVLLLLPIAGVIVLKTITGLPYPPQTAQVGKSTEQLTSQDKNEQKTAIDKMKRHLNAAIEAINTGDYNEAKTEFDQFHDIWVPIENTFKNKSKDNYEMMEQGMGQVKENLLEATTPNKEKALAGLQTLSETLAAYTNSVLK